MPDEPQNNPESANKKRETPPPVLVAQEALRILAAEEGGVPEGLNKKLPAFAMQLAKTGQDVTRDILLARVRAGELEKEASTKPKQKAYAEIVARFAVAKTPVVNTVKEAASTGDLDTLKRLVSEGANVHDLDDAALKRAAWNGHLDIVKYLVEEQGANVHGLDDAALRYAAACGRLDVVKYLMEEHGADERGFRDEAMRGAANNGYLDVVKYLIEEQGADVHSCDDDALRLAASAGHLDVVKYLVEEQGANTHAFDDAALRWSAWSGHLDVVKYLVEEQGADVHVGHGELLGFRDDALSMAASRDHLDVANYLVKEQGADPAVLSDEKRQVLRDYIKARKLWQRAAHIDPPHDLFMEDPAYFKSWAFEAVRDMLRQEGYSDVINSMSFSAVGLFGTEDRVLQYLEKWGQMGKRPLHDVIQMIRLPEKKTQEMDLAAWGDAVLKCGPSMAKLVKFADRLSVPEKTDDGRTWSMVKTREKVSQFVYKSATENPALAALCMEHDVDEKDFNKALKLTQKSPTVKNIPDITVEGEQFDMPGATFRRLAANDIRGLFLGEMTDCCQSIGGIGAKCAEYGFTSENAGFYVVENAKGRIVGQTFAWRGENGELVFDSLETLGKNVRDDQWLKLTATFKEALTEKPDNVTALHIGKGGATPKRLTSAFNNASVSAKPLGYDGYRDSHKQVVVWKM